MASIGVNESQVLGPVPEEKVKILVVDDRPANLLALESILEDLGQEIVKASSGKEALRHILNDDFALILLDVRMPEMDGFETASLIRERERSRHTPILFLTAHKDEEHVFRGYYAGAVDFLYKPINPEVLRSKVNVFVDLNRKSQLLKRHAEILESRNSELERLIAERKRAEEEVRRLNGELEERVRRRTAELSDSNDELRQFAYAASHDLQEPMRTIGSYTQLLQRRMKGQDDAEVQEFLAYIVDAVRRMSTLLNDLLVYSQVSEGRAEQTEDVDCEAVLNATLMNLDSSIRESRAEIDHEPLPVLPFDFARLTQVFQNLVSNAIKYRRASAAPRIRISAAEQDSEWRFAVSDNGMGIDPRYCEQVFGVFKRLHGKEFPGTGMGLAIVKKIIERRGGRVWVESSLETGSTFHFTIPK